MKEESLQRQVCTYLKYQYPKVIFNSDLSGIKLTIGQCVKLKSLRSSRAFPDLVIYEARGPYYGLFIELKQEGTRLFKRDGKTFSTPHIAEQACMLDELITRGYLASFACGYDEAKLIIDRYLKTPHHETDNPFNQLIPGQAVSLFIQTNDTDKLHPDRHTL